MPCSFEGVFYKWQRVHSAVLSLIVLALTTCHPAQAAMSFKLIAPAPQNNPNLDPRLLARNLYWQGWRISKIGQHLGIKPATVHSWKQRDNSKPQHWSAPAVRKNHTIRHSGFQAA